MKIAVLQFNPVKGDVRNNLTRAEKILLKGTGDVDILVLPEMAFTGTHFNSLQEIYPHLEPTDSGITSVWAGTMARKYECTVVAPYPEKVDIAKKWPASPEYYNSAILVNEKGERIAKYRKVHLSRSDRLWALEGEDDYLVQFVPRLGIVTFGLGIGMGSEPTKYPFELANYLLRMNSNVLIVSMACPTIQVDSSGNQNPQEPDMDCLLSWITQLEPIIRRGSGEEVMVIFANRTGTEDGIIYAGTSAVIGISDGEVKVYGVLGRDEKGVLAVDTSNGPCGKLVYRPGETITRELSEPYYDSSRASLTSSTATTVLISESSFGWGGRKAESGLSEGKPERHAHASWRALPKLSINTQAEALENPPADWKPGVLTPTHMHPSPTPMTMRPRLQVPPVESFTQSYLDPVGMAPTFYPPSQQRGHFILDGEVTVHSAIETPISPSVYWIPQINKLRATGAIAHIDTPIDQGDSWTHQAYADFRYMLKESPRAETNESPKSPKAFPLREPPPPAEVRPASPKSRNASRQRGENRADSVPAQRDLTYEEVTQKLSEVALRAESAQGRRTPATRARDDTPRRTSTPCNVQDQRLASVMRIDAQGRQSPTPRIRDGTRSTSSTRPDGRPLNTNLPTELTDNVEENQPGSRGGPPTTSEPVCSSSRQTEQELGSENSQPKDLSQFMRVEEYPSPNCRVHNLGVATTREES